MCSIAIVIVIASVLLISGNRSVSFIYFHAIVAIFAISVIVFNYFSLYGLVVK
jgi:hypothetical protein